MRILTNKSMSGGQLVVLDRSGRDVKRFPLARGLVTLGSDHSCDIRFMLDTVNPHHATIAVHANQTVVRNVCEGETLVNGAPVSVAALRDGDLITIGGRRLRWEYAQPQQRRAQAPQPTLYVARRRVRARGRASGPGGAGAARRDRSLELALEMTHRASMPANAGGKQVAIVQPQRRDTSEHNDNPSPRTPMSANKRPRVSKSDIDVSVNYAEAEKSKRKPSLQNTTQATLWIESRKTSPRKSVKVQSTPANVLAMRRSIASSNKSTPLRLTVLKRAQSAQKTRVTKIEAPTHIDHTKQAALLLMTGHTPKARLLTQKSSTTPKSATIKVVTPKTNSPKNTPDLVSLKSVTPRLVRSKSAAASSVSPKISRRSASLVIKKKSPINRSTPRGRSARSSAVSTSTQKQVSPRTSLRKSTRRSSQKSLEKSPLLPNPKKSALKNPSKRSMRKTESIKFDLSNLDNYSQDSNVLMLTDTTHRIDGSSGGSGNDFSLRYSTSGIQSPSPRRSIHSRSSKIMEKTLGTTMTLSPSKTLTPESPRPRKSSRSSMIVQEALNNSEGAYSRRSSKSLSERSHSTVASAFRTRTLSPRTPQDHLESYSIVDLVSVDSNESSRSASVYNSVGSTSSATFGTPQNSVGRKTRSTMDPGLVGSSTPYVKVAKMAASHSNPEDDNSNIRERSRTTKSLSTPENTTRHISVNSTKISRASRSRSRINDSDLMLIELEDADDSPRSSRRVGAASKRSSSAPEPRNKSFSITTSNNSPIQENGMSTPENRQSPEEASTPVLNIKNFLNSSQNSIASVSNRKRGRPSLKRKTIGTLTEQNKIRVSTKSKSMNFQTRMTRSRLSNDSYEDLNISNQQDDEAVTPKSEVKLVQEAVKNKHSTAKKPQSKRSIIDDLNNSDIVKQLFNSPVKRKLSQSMTEFSRKQLFDEDIVQRKPTRKTVAAMGRTPEYSLLNRTENITPERFVSPISTPSHSPNLDGIKRLFTKNTPENDLRNVRGVKALLRSPRARKSIRNDLTNVSGTKQLFAKSPRNSLSDVRVKEIFVASPSNDLRRVSGVRSLFQSKKTRKSPRNSLTDIRGVKHLYRRNKNELDDLSGVEELFNESNQSNRDTDSIFDQLVGKPVIRSVYSNTFSSKSAPKNSTHKYKSLHASIDVITNNVQEWLEQELNKRLRKDAPSSAKSTNKSQLSRALQKLATNTVEGTTPLRTSRVRNNTTVRTSTVEVPERQKSASEVYSAHKLPIKKRSWVNASLERTKNSSKSIYLPIKKRAVLHSTPVKGTQANMTMNASELGRVSPIIADKTQDLEQEKTSNIPTIMSRSRRVTKPISKSPPVNKPSPKRATGKLKVVTLKKDEPTTSKVKQASLVSTPVTSNTGEVKAKSSPAKKVGTSISKTANTRTTRTRKTVAVTPQADVKSKRRASLVITKKTPVLRPQPRPSRKRKESEAMSMIQARSPKRTRATRKNDEKLEKPKTPKTSRARVQKSTVVVSKPSPQIKPRGTRTKATQSPSATSSSTKQTAIKDKKVSAKKSPVEIKPIDKDVPKTRGRRAAVDQKSKQNISEADLNQPKTKRGRNITAEVPTVGRKTRNAKQVSIQKEPEVKKRNSPKDNTVEEASKHKTRTNKEIVSKETNVKKSRTTKKEVVQGQSTRSTRKGKAVTTATVNESSSGRSQDSAQSEPGTRSRRGARSNNTVVAESSTRKRKAAVAEDRPTKLIKNVEVESRGRSKKLASPKTDNVAKNKGKKQPTGDASQRATRGKKVDVSLESPKELQRTVRARKTVVVTEPVSEVGKRKRKNATLVEESSKKLRGGKASASVAESQKRARSTRATASVEAAAKTSGRSRRR